MIQHTSSKLKIVFYLLCFTFFSCKKVSPQENIKVSSEKKEKKQIKNVWKFEKIFSISPQSNYTCPSQKYNNFIFGLESDSVFINNQYADNVYTNSTSSKSYFSKNYLYEAYKKRLKEEVNIDLPQEIKSIRNKKAYDKTSLLDQYFRDAFFIGEYMFFEDNGCIICFKNTSINIENKAQFKFNTLKLPYQNKIDFKNVKYSKLSVQKISGLSEFACGEEQIRYIPLEKTGKINLILVPMDCGDTTYRYYLLSLSNNIVISNLYVEGELYEPENNDNPEITSFTISKESIITVKTINKDFQNKNEEKRYTITDLGKIVENT